MSLEVVALRSTIIGEFAYHLRKLLRQSLVALNKAETRYTITNLGKIWEHVSSS
jgi:hypothetical protein